MNFLRKYWSDILIKRKISRNQKNIIGLAKLMEDTLCLESKPLKGGNIEHYYPFIFDLVLPVSHLIKKLPPHTILAFESFGPLTNEFVNLFPGRVKIVNNYECKDVNKMIGMNPKALNALTFNIEPLRKMVFKNLELRQCDKPNKVLLIERSSPDDYYLTKAKNKGAGILRRSIINHRDLANMLRNEISDDYDFQNLVLEGLPIKEQIEHFKSAVLVIAQHGAGLANAIWMKKGTFVIEFGFRATNSFKKVSAMRKQNYFLFQDYNEQHITINIDDFRKWLSANHQLNRFLK